MIIAGTMATLIVWLKCILLLAGRKGDDEEKNDNDDDDNNIARDRMSIGDAYHHRQGGHDRILENKSAANLSTL